MCNPEMGTVTLLRLILYGFYKIAHPLIRVGYEYYFAALAMAWLAPQSGRTVASEQHKTVRKGLNVFRYV